MTKKIVILTEKPSVAVDFANALGATKKDGYFESDRYIITYTFGHLFEIDESILPKPWSMEDLPIPKQFFMGKYCIKKDKKTRKPDPGVLKQFKVIKALLKNTDTAINAGDAGREGELIQRIVLQESNFKGKTLRIWTSEALTNQVITRELKNGLKDGREFDSLYYAALARAYGDFAVGINLTRAISLMGKQLLRVGRVQTPTLYFVYKRFKERQEFKKEDYFVISATFEKDGSIYEGVINFDTKDNEEELRIKEEEAKRIIALIQKEKTGVVEKKIIQKKTELPPLLHSITSLQQEANKLYGFTAQQTLGIAQSLYEKKLISYPRTESRYLGEANLLLVKDILKTLGKDEYVKEVDNIGSRMFDSSKLTDHHALIPLSVFSGNDDEKKVYDLIFKRFIGFFMGDYIYEQISIYTRVDKYNFKTTSKKVLQHGWKALVDEDKEAEKTILLFLQENDKVSIVETKTQKKQTQPPQTYTEATLLQSMEKMNLGTAATRAAIIESLKSSGYIFLAKKSIDITPKGIDLIEMLQDSNVNIYQPELTQKWESQLESIYRNKKGYSTVEAFLDDLYKEIITPACEKIKNTTKTIRRAPTAKMINLAKKIAKEKTIKLDKSILQDFEKCKEFLNKTLKK